MEPWGKSMSTIIEQDPNANTEKQFIESIDITGYTCLDVGFNYGWWSALFLKQIGKEGKVYAWEPNTFLFTNHLSKWPFKNLQGYDNALSDRTSESDFYIHAEEGTQSGYNSLEPMQSYQKKITVKTDTLDNWWKKNSKPNVDFIKIDCEGHDLKVVKGGQEMIKATMPTFVVIEQSDEDVSDLFRSMNYTDQNEYNEFGLNDKVWTT
tara:strand:- start:66 stop:689 length:624 start_codon:yes stop_codon:yes gene_type:complete